jgi:hypothetical protein
MNRMSERETVVELPWAADRCPWVEKLRTVLPLPVGIRDECVGVRSTEVVEKANGANTHPACTRSSSASTNSAWAASSACQLLSRARVELPMRILSCPCASSVLPLRGERMHTPR